MGLTERELVKLSDCYIESSAGQDALSSLQLYAAIAGVNLKNVRLSGLERLVVNNIFKTANAQNKLEELLRVIDEDAISHAQPDNVSKTLWKLDVRNEINYLPTNPFIPSSVFQTKGGLIFNPTTKMQRGFVKLSITGASEVVSIALDLPPGYSEIPALRFPRYLPAETAFITNTLAPVSLSVELWAAQHAGPVDIVRFDLWVTQPNFVLLAKQSGEGTIVDFSGFLSLMVNSGADGLENFLASNSAGAAPKKSRYSQNGINIAELYQALRVLQLNYLPTETPSEIFSRGSLIQRVTPPGALLTGVSRHANCLDSCLLFASLLERLGIESVIVILPGHALVGWKPPLFDIAGSSFEEVLKNCIFLDVSLSYSGIDFEAAISAAEGWLIKCRYFLEHQGNLLQEFAQIIDVTDSRRSLLDLLN